LPCLELQDRPETPSLALLPYVLSLALFGTIYVLLVKIKSYLGLN